MADNERPGYEELLTEAAKAYRSLRLDQALELYRAAEGARPDGYEAHLGLSRTLGRLRRLEEASAEARRCIELDPQRFGGHASLAILHWLSNRDEDAVVALKRAIALAPAEPEPHLTLAQVQADLGRPDAAQAELDTAQSLIAAIGDDDLRNWALALARHVEAYLRLKEGNDAEAMLAAQEAVDLQDVNRYAASLALCNLGILQARAHRYLEGIEYLERARQLNPHLSLAGGALGRLYLLTHNHERAVEVLGEAVQEATEDGGSTRLAYATALARLGRRAEAHGQYRQALKEGLGGRPGLVARWQLVWLSTWGRRALIGVVVVGVLAWVLLGEPSPAALTVGVVAVLILFLQMRFGRARG